MSIAIFVPKRERKKKIQEYHLASPLYHTSHEMMSTVTKPYDFLNISLNESKNIRNCISGQKALLNCKVWKGKKGYSLEGEKRSI